MECRDYSYIKRNFDALRYEVASISERLGTAVPTIVAVTKSADDQELIELMRAGAVDIGENRPGELARRGAIIRDAGFRPTLHEIGTLQRNKIKLIIDTVSLIHSVDNIRLGRDINRLAAAAGRVVPVLIEVNSALEESKGGVAPSECEALLNELLPLENIRVSGLMTMGPPLPDPEGLRKYFRETKNLFDRLCRDYGLGENPILSMGMSDSYRVAIEEGSTLIRVGRKLFIR